MLWGSGEYNSSSSDVKISDPVLKKPSLSSLGLQMTLYYNACLSALNSASFPFFQLSS